MRAQFFVVCCFLFAGHFINAEVIKFRQCSEDPNEFPCEVHEIRLNPCKEAAKNSPCKVKKGTAPNIALDFTPKFDGDIKVQAYWAKSTGDVAFGEMDTDGCKFASCPVADGTRTTLTYDLFLAKTLPSGLYDVKWKIFNNENKECCAILRVKLMK